MENLLTLVLFFVSNAACFWIGVRAAEGRANGGETAPAIPGDEPLNVPDEDLKSQKAVETMLRNIDVYDGTGMGQEEIQRF